MHRRKLNTSSNTFLKPFWITLGVIILLIIFFILGYHFSRKPSSTSSQMFAAPTNTYLFDIGNKKITLNNHLLAFKNSSYKASHGSEVATITNLTINPSGTRATAILIDSPGGTGTFYYLIGGVLKNGQEIYSKPVLLGDRIKIKSLSVYEPQAHDNGIITVQYLDRPASAPMLTMPTIQILKQFAFEDNGNLIEVLH